MKKIFCTVMLALAMSAGVSAENAANGAVGNANGKTSESKYVPTEGNLAARAASRTLSSASSCIGDFTVCSLPASGQ